MERKSHRKYLCQDLRFAQIIVNIYPKNTIIFTITQAQRKSHRKYLRWDLRSTWIIVNIIVNFWSKFTIIWAERKSHRKYLRWDLRSTRIIVNIYDNISVNIYDNDLWLLTHSWRESHAFLAFLGHFKFWMGFWHVLRCKGLKIQNLKHTWKS